MKNTKSLVKALPYVATSFWMLGFLATAIAGDEAKKAEGSQSKGSIEKKADDKDYAKLPKPGEKVSLGADHYFTYGFDRQPKMGQVVMKVEIFTRDGKRDTSFTVKGDMDMPSMRGAHSTGEKAFSKSNKGYYLLPASIVMPGDWEFRFTFEKDGKTVLLGAYLFDV